MTTNETAVVMLAELQSLLRMAIDSALRASEHLASLSDGRKAQTYVASQLSLAARHMEAAVRLWHQTVQLVADTRGEG